MQGLPPPPVYRWVVPEEHAVREAHRVSFDMARRSLDARDHGTVDALHWMTIGDLAPVGQRAVEATWERARAESWLALCLAAGRELPTERDWRRLGMEPYPAVRTDPAYCYGAWRAATQASAERDRQDALLHWQHIRQRADPAA